MADNYSEILSRIISTFENNFSSLSPAQKLHWYIRMYRISGEKKYVEPLRKYFYQVYGNKNYFVLKGPKKTPRSIRKWEFYSKNPDVYFYKKEAMKIFNYKVFGIDIGEELVKIKKADWEQIIFKSGLITEDPSEAVNIVYYLQYCGLLDLEDQVLDYFKIEVNKEPVNEAEWKDLIYGLNHTVIAGSYYYQRFLKEDEYDFIGKYFLENTEKIIKFTNADVVAETGVCLKLLGCTGEKINTLKDFVTSKFDEKLGFIPKDDGGKIGDCEHRNILAVMLFTNFSRLYKGPIIGK